MFLQASKCICTIKGASRPSSWLPHPALSLPSISSAHTGSELSSARLTLGGLCSSGHETATVSFVWCLVSESVSDRASLTAAGARVILWDATPKPVLLYRWMKGSAIDQWDGTIQQGSVQNTIERTGHVASQHDIGWGGSRTIPLSAFGFLKQTLSPLSCYEDLKPWLESLCVV